MDCQRAMENTIGKMDHFIREISSKEPEMGMVFGKTNYNSTKVTICWTKSMAMESMSGEMATYTKASGWMISDMARELSYLKIKYNMRDIGIMVSKPMKNQL